jgi:hypothetical protein
MKNYKILIIALLFTCVAHSQIFDKGIVTGPMTTAEINAISNPQEARLIFNSTTKTIWTYNGTIWVDSGTDNQTLAQVLSQGNDANGFPITNLSDPTIDQDAATKFYVDSNDDDSQGLSLAGNTLNISNGAGVDLTPILGGGGGTDYSTPVNVDLLPSLSDNINIGSQGNRFASIFGGVLWGAIGVNTPELRLTGVSSAFTPTSNGSIWYDLDNNLFKAMQNGLTVDLISGGITANLTSVLAQGNIAGTSIDMNNNFIDNAQYLVFRDVNADTREWTIIETFVDGYVGDLSFLNGPFPASKMYIPLDGVIDQPLHAVTKAYADANYSGGGGSLTTDQINRLDNASRDPLSFAVSADRVLIPEDRTFDSGGSIGRKKILTAATEVTLTIDNSYAVDDVQRFSTTGSGIVNLVPDAGVTLAYAGKTTLEGATMSGEGAVGYIKKQSSNNYTFYSTSITGFAINSNDVYEDQSPIHYFKPESLIASGATDGSAITGWDDTIGTFNGTAVGSVTLNLDGTEQEAEFDGGYIDFPDVASVDFDNQTDSYTFVWKTGTVQATTGYYFSKHNNSGRQYGVYIGSGNDNAIVGGSETIGGAIPSTGNIVYVLTVNASTYNLYRDGVQVITNATVSAAQDIGQSLNFGSRTDGGFLYNGSLERVAIYDRELTPSQITTFN